MKRTTARLKKLTRIGLASGLCFFTAWVGAAQLAPEVQAQVDAAVKVYQLGQMDSARAAFERLARLNVPAAQYNLAVMHLRGELPRSDLKVARRLLEGAGSAGFVTAQVMLGRGLESGEIGPRDLVLAHNWYELAAASGDAESILAMGTAHFLGRGRPQDYARAADWFRESAKGGDVGAMYLLATLYEKGEGVELDLRLARYWFEAAAQAGDVAAPSKLREVDARLAAATKAS